MAHKYPTLYKRQVQKLVDLLTDFIGLAIIIDDIDYAILVTVNLITN